MQYKSRRNFTRKLVLSITSLSIIGLIIVYIIVNTMFRTIIYENVIGVTQRDVQLISQEVDYWFDRGNQIVQNISRLWVELGVDYIERTANVFLDEHYFISEIIAGFEDGSFVSASDWTFDEGWIATTRPWYVAAKEAAGPTVIIIPYKTALEGSGTVTSISKWIPDLGGMEAVVGVVIDVNAVVDMLNDYRLAENGYLMLIGPGGEIISHPKSEIISRTGGNVYLYSIPNGWKLMDNILNGGDIIIFDDIYLGESYFITFELETTGWTLAAVLPTHAVLEPVQQYLWPTMLASSAVIVALFVLTMVFMSFLTRNMEESKVAEERLRIIIDNMPLVSNFRDRDFNILECNAQAAQLFDLESKEEYIARFFELSPEYQPDGSASTTKAEQLISKTFETGRETFEWLHQKIDGTPIPTKVTLIRTRWNNEENLIAFVEDLRDFYLYRQTEQLARHRLQAMLDSSPILVTIFDDNNEVLETNEVAVDMLEIPNKQAYIDNFLAFSPQIQPGGTSSSKVAQDMFDVARRDGKVQFEWMFKTSKGELIPSEETIKSVRIGEETMLIAYSRDLRDFYKYKETEKIAQQRLHAMLNSSPLACSIIDDRCNVLEVNDEGLRLFELQTQEEYISHFFDLSPKYQPDGRYSREKMFEKLHLCLRNSRANFEWMFQTIDGRHQIPCEITFEKLIVDNKDLVIAYIRDLREVNKAVEMVRQLESAAFTDPLTGARNRRYFMDEAEKELHECLEKRQDYALIMLDVDHFKAVNDTYGHPVGDEVLKILVARISNTLKKDTLLARYGGEEFIITLPKTGFKDVMSTAERIRQAIDGATFSIENLDIAITISLGVAMKPPEGITLQELIINTDKALYKAKNAGRNKVIMYNR